MKVNQKLWDGFVRSNKSGSFLQSWVWGEMQDRMKIPFWRLVVEKEGSIKAAALVIKREMMLGQSWFYVPYGPVVAKGDWPDIQKQLIDLAEKEKVSFIRVEPLDLPAEVLEKNDWRKCDHDIQPRNTAVMDLGKSEEEMLAGMNQKTRYNIRLAKKKGVEIEFRKDKQAVNEFLYLSKQVSKRSGFHYHEDKYYQVMQQALGDMFEVGIAKFHGEVLAAHLLISYGDTTTYAHGASGVYHRSVMAPHLLQWESMMRAKNRGLKNMIYLEWRRLMRARGIRGQALQNLKKVLEVAG